MVMIFRVPILVGDVAHATLLLGIGIQKPKVPVITQHNPRCGDLDSSEISLLTSQDAAMAALLEVWEVTPMILDRHRPVVQRTLDVVEMRLLTPDAGDEYVDSQTR